MIDSNDCYITLSGGMHFLAPSCSSGTATTTRDNNSDSNETQASNYRNNPSREAITHTGVGIRGGPTILEGVIAALGRTMAVAFTSL